LNGVTLEGRCVESVARKREGWGGGGTDADENIVDDFDVVVRKPLREPRV